MKQISFWEQGLVEMPAKIKINAFHSDQFALDPFILQLVDEPTLLKSDFYNKLIGSLGFQGIKLLNCVVYCISISGRLFSLDVMWDEKSAIFIQFPVPSMSIFLHTMLIVKENFSQRYIIDNENK